MSVVNKMLQDLEKRQQQPQSADYQPPAKSRHGWWLVGVLPLAMLAFAGYWLLPDWLEKITHQESLDTINEQQQSTAAVKADPASAKSGSKDTGSGRTTEPSTTQTAGEPEQVPVAAPPDLMVPEPRTPGLAPSARVTGSTAQQQVTPTPSAALTIKTADTDTPSQWALLKVRVQQAIADKRPLDAVADLKRMLAIQGDSHQVRLKLAALMHDTGMRAQAGLLLEEGVKLYPEQAELRLMLARWLQGNNSQEQALSVLQEIQPELLGHPDFYALRAQLAQQQNQLELAISDYLLLSQYQPDRFKWRLGLAVALDRAGRLPAALEQYNWLKGQNLPPEARQFVQQRLQVLGG